MNDLHLEFQWLKKCILASCNETTNKSENTIPPPKLDNLDHAYTRFVNENSLKPEERLLIILALLPHISHKTLHDLNIEGNPALLQQLPTNGAMLPTGETFLFLVAGTEEHKKLDYHYLFDTTHLFYKKSILNLGTVNDEVPVSYGVLSLHDNFRELFLYNRHSSPRFSDKFPAHLLKTPLSWEDLILNEQTIQNIDEIKAYLSHEDLLRGEMGLGKHLKPGYRILFYGPSGTGKTLTASLLGKYLEKEVYRVDLSTVISKYIGETSKNLNTLFNVAEDKGWILFFDEGDALFGKRTNSGNGDNKNATYANQDVAFLLQRIENFNGLIIVATNFKENLDPAFTRRFQSIVPFNLPKTENRLRLWKENLPSNFGIDSDISLDRLAEKYPLSAASIIKVIQRSTLLSLKDGNDKIVRSILEQCLNNEVFITKQSLRR